MRMKITMTKKTGFELFFPRCMRICVCIRVCVCMCMYAFVSIKTMSTQSRVTWTQFRFLVIIRNTSVHANDNDANADGAYEVPGVRANEPPSCAHDSSTRQRGKEAVTRDQ